MNYRLATLLASEDATAAATKTIDLDMEDCISQILIYFNGMNNGNTPFAHPAKMVSKIEIVDGSDVVMSLSGLEAQALDFYHTGKSPFSILNWQDNVEIEALFNLHFGRYLYDPLFALDPKRFTNLQLKITHNKASGGSACDAATLEVLAHMFDQKKISPSKYLMAKEIYTYSMTAGAYEYIDLPADHPYRMMLVGSLYAGQEPSVQLSNVKLDENTDARIVFDKAGLELFKAMVRQFGPCVETHEGIVGTGEISFYTMPTQNMHVVTGGFGGNRDYYGGYAPWGGKVGIWAGASSTYFQSVFSGFAPHGFLAIPFGDLMLAEDWYNVAGIKKLRLTVKGGNTLGTCETVLQQARAY